jgi:uncharacterized protein with HEPN domain
LSQFEYVISFNLVLFFIARARIAASYIEKSTNQVSDMTLMAKDSVRMNLIRIHSGLHRNSEFRKFKSLLPWDEFTVVRNKMAHDIKNVDETRGIAILFELLGPLEKILQDLVKGS